MKYTVIIPAVENDRLNVCLNSIDDEIIKNVIVYKNAPHIVTDKKVELVGTGVNDGLSAAWNVGRKNVIDNEQDYLIIVSQNVNFLNGLKDFVSELERQKPKYGVWSDLGWHTMALARHTLEEAGEFDTNCYPAYYEDNEYAIRLYKLNMIDNFYEIKVRGEVVSGLSTQLGIRVNVEKIKKYITSKWGQPFHWMNYHDQNFYRSPYNNSEYDITYFHKKTTEELMEEYGYENNPKELYVHDQRKYL